MISGGREEFVRRGLALSCLLFPRRSCLERFRSGCSSEGFWCMFRKVWVVERGCRMAEQTKHTDRVAGLFPLAGKERERRAMCRKRFGVKIHALFFPSFYFHFGSRAGPPGRAGWTRAGFARRTNRRGDVRRTDGRHEGAARRAGLSLFTHGEGRKPKIEGGGWM